MSFINEDRTIWELPVTSTVKLSDLVVIVSEGETKQATINQLDSIGYQGTDLKDLSANWQSTFTTVANTSANWDSVYTTVNSNSSNYILHGGNFKEQNLTVGTNDNFHLNFETAGSNRVIILSSGEVGIGSSTPVEKLTVDGNVNVTGSATFSGSIITHNSIHSFGEFIDQNTINLENDGGVQVHLNANSNADANLKTITNHSLVFGTNNTKRMTIKENGFIGVNTSSPASLFTIKGGGTSGDMDNAPELRIEGFSGYIDFHNSLLDNGVYNTITRASDKALIFSDGVESTGNLTIAPWSLSAQYGGIRITNEGKVGVGLHNPSSRLDVNGDITITDRIQRRNNFGACIRFPLNNVFTIETDSVERLRVTSSGNVGINTMAPTEKLEVDGNIKASGNIQAANTLNWDSTHTVVQNTSANWNSTYQTVNALSATWQPFMVNCTDENTPFIASTTTPVYRFAMPYTMRLSEVRAFVSTPPVGVGSTPLQIDVKRGVDSIFSSKLFVNNASNTSVGSLNPAVIQPSFSSGPGLLDNDIISVYIETVGSTTPGTGLKLLFK
jgi:hypothetical protein